MNEKGNINRGIASFRASKLVLQKFELEIDEDIIIPTAIGGVIADKIA